MFFGKEKTSIASIFLLILGFIGIYLIVSKGTLTLISFSLGTIMALGAALAWAIFSYMLKKAKSIEDTIAMFWYSVFGLVFLITCLPFYDISYSISGKALLGLLYVAIFPTAIAFLLWGKALSRLPAHICSSIALLTPVFSLIIIAIFLKEKIITMQVIGLGLVIASTAVNIYLSKGKK